MVWFRREIELTAAQAKQPATLSLGLLDDVGRVWINGKPVAMSARSWQPSSFDVPPGVLKAGRNVLIVRSEEHTSELQSLMRISYAVFCLKKKKKKSTPRYNIRIHNEKYKTVL